MQASQFIVSYLVLESSLTWRKSKDGTKMLSHRRRDKFSKIAVMNARTVLSRVDFWTLQHWRGKTDRTRQSIPRGCSCWLERPLTDGGANCPWHHQVRRRSTAKSLLYSIGLLVRDGLRNVQTCSIKNKNNFNCVTAKWPTNKVTLDSI